MNFIPLPFYAPMDPLTGIELSTLMDYLFAFFLSSIRFYIIDCDGIAKKIK